MITCVTAEPLIAFALTREWTAVPAVGRRRGIGSSVRSALARSGRTVGILTSKVAKADVVSAFTISNGSSGADHWYLVNRVYQGSVSRSGELTVSTRRSGSRSRGTGLGNDSCK